MYFRWMGRKNENEKKAMMMRYMSPMETQGVAVAGPKGRRSMLVKPTAGEIACGARAMFSGLKELFCITERAHEEPILDIIAFSKALSCGITYVGTVELSRADT